MDVSGDGQVAPNDRLMVRNCLNRQTEGVTCKYSRLNYVGEQDHVRIWDSIFKDSSGTGRAGKIFDFASTSSIKNACLRKNIEAAALACSSGPLRSAEQLEIGSNHQTWAMAVGGTWQGTSVATSKDAAKTFCSGLIGKDLDTCIRTRESYSDCKPQAVEYFMANSKGRSFEQLRQEDPQFASMCYVRDPSIDDCLHSLLIKDESAKNTSSTNYAYLRYRDALTAAGVNSLNNSAVSIRDTTFVRQDGKVYDQASNNNGDFSITRIYDENCRALSQTELANIDPATICDNVNMRALISPISLRWSAKGDSKESYSVTNFPLENVPGKYYLWRASSDMPLLVYDPAHRGVITSATQLFGGWTFGGKGKTASITSTSAANAEWDNGFEALATLDRDRNNIVDGDELTDLSLWFDENQNGVSERGEVKPVRDLGITKLLYGPIVKDADGKSVSVKLGFERIQDNRVISGESIDWYSDSYESRTEAVMNFEANRQLSGALPSLQDTLTKEQQAQNAAAVGTVLPPVIWGAWEWQADEIEQKEGSDKSAPLSGFFHFHQTDKGTNGVSLLELPVEITHPQKGVLPARSLANAVPFIIKDVTSTTEGAEMVFVGDIMGVASTARVKLTRDATSNVATLSGITQSVYKNPKTGKEAALRYAWTAKPLVVNSPAK